MDGEVIDVLWVGTRRLLAGAVTALLLCLGCGRPPPEPPAPVDGLPLPDPSRAGPISVEEVLADRRSIRSFSPDALTKEQLAQLLWAAQGITDPIRGFRAAPSAGATYPLEVLVAVGRVEGLAPGLYRYVPGEHALTAWKAEDIRDALAQAALRQRWIADAPTVLVLAAAYERTTSRYGPRGERYVHMEVGHVAQNLYLQAQALGLGTVMVGAFDDEVVRELLSTDEAPLAILPVGIPAR